MSVQISDILSRKVEKLPSDAMDGATRIRPYTFYQCSLLTEVHLPKTLNRIEDDAFGLCTSIENVIWDDDMDPCILIGTQVNADITSGHIFFDSKWAASFPLDSMICVVKNRILIANTITDGANGLIIPDAVVNLGSYSCARYSSDAYNNDTLTSIVVPDSVEIIQDNVFNGHSILTKITVGSSVKHIGYRLVPNTTDTILICRQPTEMNVELPVPGDGTGLAYNKDSHNITIYTDNECIKNYNWSGDNVVATFYPLSQAPT